MSEAQKGGEAAWEYAPAADSWFRRMAFANLYAYGPDATGSYGWSVSFLVADMSSDIEACGSLEGAKRLATWYYARVLENEMEGVKWALGKT